MKQISEVFTALGTANEISVSVPDREEERVLLLVRKLKEHVFQLDNSLSVFKSDSETCAIARSAGKSAVQVSEETRLLISRAIDGSILTGGTFDITAGPLIRLWEKARREEELPAEEEIRKAVLLTDYRDITVEATPFRVGLRYPGQSLDFGSMAKGYAADYVKTELKENGINDFLINFGGTVMAGEQEREIGIRNPFADAGHPAGYLTMKNSAAVTSGIYENGFRKNGKWYHHLIDPATGYPAEEGLSGVTLIGDSAEKLDILTTMVFVKGIRKSLPVLEAENTDGIFITQNGEIYTTPALSESFRKGNEIHVRNESA